MARTVMLEFDIEHLREFGGLSSGVTWRLILHAASMLLARRREAWPGPEPKLKRRDPKKDRALIEEYQAKGRTVSVAWDEFEEVVCTAGIWTKDATLRSRASDVVLDGYGHDYQTDTMFEFRLIGGHLRCERSDGIMTTIEKLVRLGEAYWNAFSERKD